MTQKEITTKISLMYYNETLKPSATEIEIYGGEITEIATGDYVEWLERKVYNLTTNKGA